MFGGKWVSTFSLLLRPGLTEEDGAPNMWQKTYFKAIILENIKIEEVTYKPRPLPPLGSFHSLAVEKKWRDLWLAAGSHWITTFYHNFSQSDHFGSASVAFVVFPNPPVTLYHCHSPSQYLLLLVICY